MKNDWVPMQKIGFLCRRRTVPLMERKTSLKELHLGAKTGVRSSVAIMRHSLKPNFDKYVPIVCGLESLLAGVNMLTLSYITAPILTWKEW
jgi:hypothetical protein